MCVCGGMLWEGGVVTLLRMRVVRTGFLEEVIMDEPQSNRWVGTGYLGQRGRGVWAQESPKD